jgi:hypothetical protein
MAINYETFNLYAAIELYVGRKVDFNTEVIVDIVTEAILDWNIESKTQPSIIELDTLWDAERLNWYKRKQKDKIRSQFQYMCETGSEGCLTTILDTNGNRIRMDARRGNVYNDVQNYQLGIEYMVRKNITSIPYRDFYNNYHMFNVEQATQVYNEVVDYDFETLQKKWNKELEIDQCTTIVDVLNVDWNS